MFEAKILAASVNTAGERLTTFQLTYPRFIHGEFLTHRMFSRNAESSRAMPIGAMLRSVIENPVIPIHWGANQKGMQAENLVTEAAQARCEREWLISRDNAVRTVMNLNEEGLHKQIANRILEPFAWITVICSTTSFEHFRRLRCHKDAEPHFQKIAYLMAEAYDAAEPILKEDDEWHLPLVGFDGDELLSCLDPAKVSTARCGRVSYLTHDGRRDVEADLRLHDQLKNDGHWSPFEHPAIAVPGTQNANYKGWLSYRKMFPTEFIPEPLVTVS